MPKKNPYTYLKTKYKIYSTRKFNTIHRIYTSPAEFEAKARAEPYETIYRFLNKTFKSADELILQLFPDMRKSAERCKWCCFYLLKQNESNGHTRLNASALFQQVNQYYPEVLDFVFEVVTNDGLFYYDADSKWVSIARTYENERLIADNILRRIANPAIDKMDWKAYNKVGDIELTDEQMGLLEAVCNNSIVMLNGSAGCVDCDTEFFNGNGWKRIADYKDGDKVLQYNDDGTAELVGPLAYIKKPTDYLWHFETKYGVNQTLCDEHNIVYWSPKKVRHECKIFDIINAQLNKKGGWDGRFKTTFAYGGSGIDLTDEQIRVMCAVICDGSFYSHVKEQNDSYYRCRFHVKKERKHERLRLLFSRANIEWREVKSAAEGYIDFYINAPMRTKQFDAYWYNCSQHQLQVICDEVMFWGGNTNTTKAGTIRNRFSTAIKETAEFLQFAFSACGQRATISVNDRSGQQYLTCGKWYTRKSIEYNVVTTNRTEVGICYDGRVNHIRTMPQQVPTIDGYKYCFTVPSHMLVLRRNGNIFITGNCGKTSTVQALTKMLDDNLKFFTLLAPTGIAAKRLKQVTGYPASTIHKFLAINGSVGDFLIIDEMSMVGVDLLATLFSRVPKKTKIILICDEAQLASISCGNIVKDIIDSDVMPIVNLTKVFRYGTSGLSTIATDIRTGKPISADMNFDDCSIVPISHKPLDDVLAVYGELRKQYSTNDIMILSPFNVREAGTFAINKAIQDKYNPNPVLTSYKRQSTDIEFKAWDRIVNTKNQYHMLGEGDSEIAVMNGDIGEVLSYDESLGVLKVAFDDGIAYLEKGDIFKQLLAYSISIHKSQGSQAKAVIVVIDSTHGFFLTRNLCYVAASRAQEKLVIVGDIDTINESLKIQEERRRNTWLKELLTK